MEAQSALGVNDIFTIEYHGLKFEIDVFSENDIIMIDEPIIELFENEGIDNIESLRLNLFLSRLVKILNKNAIKLNDNTNNQDISIEPFNS
jgi:hypothetical protein